jgi:NitT/TauT family transport system substrate-binding protein
VTLYVAIDQGLFKEVGLDPQFFWFPTGAPLLAGLKSGSIDVVTTGLATVFALGQKIPLTFIGWETDSAAGEGLVVGAQSPVKDWRDITQAKAVAAAPGTCAQVALGLLARKAGVPVGKLPVVNVAPPLFANAFKSGSIDAGLGWAPYPQTLQEQGYKVVAWDADYGPEGGVCPSLYGARPEFLKQHPEVGLKLVQVRAKAQHLMAANPKLAVDALVKRLSVSEHVARAVLERIAGPAMPTLEQEVTPGTRWSLVDARAGLARKLFVASEVLHEAGTIAAPLTWEQIQAAIDPSYIQQYLASAPQRPAKP